MNKTLLASELYKSESEKERDWVKEENQLIIFDQVVEGVGLFLSISPGKLIVSLSA